MNFYEHLIINGYGLKLIFKFRISAKKYKIVFFTYFLTGNILLNCDIEIIFNYLVIIT